MDCNWSELQASVGSAKDPLNKSELRLIGHFPIHEAKSASKQLAIEDGIVSSQGSDVNDEQSELAAAAGSCKRRVSSKASASDFVADLVRKRKR